MDLKCQTFYFVQVLNVVLNYCGPLDFELKIFFYLKGRKIELTQEIKNNPKIDVTYDYLKLALLK